MTNYGTVIDNQLHRAPRAIRIGGAVVCNPTDAQYESAGYKRVVDEPPTTDAAHYAVPVGWAEQGGEIVRQYEVRAYPPPPPRRWTPLAIKRACGERWSVLRAALDALGVLDDFLMAQELREDDEAFARGRARAVERFGDEAVEAVLKEAAHG